MGSWRLAVVTEPEYPGLRPDDSVLSAAVEARGGSLVTVPWGTPIGGGTADAVLVRTPWDYFLRPGAFFDWADSVGPPLFNPASVLRWNGHKGYLLELERTGAARLPRTVLVPEAERPAQADALAAALGAERLVLKPAISGGAHRTRVLTAGARIQWTDDDVGDFVAQEFHPAVVDEGEWSVVLLGGRPSHAVLKRARAGDFRVQEEHGGSVELVPEVPPDLAREAEVVFAGAHAALGLAAPLVQARVDLVRDPAGGRPLLMELELIEPELFLRARPGAERDLVDALRRALG